MLRLKFLRLERELSQKQLAALTKRVSQPALSMIESGRANPTPDELKVLSSILGCAPDRLMDLVSESSLTPGAEFRDAEQRS